VTSLGKVLRDLDWLDQDGVTPELGDDENGEYDKESVDEEGARVLLVLGDGLQPAWVWGGWG
jgi:hypothetical protein